MRIQHFPRRCLLAALALLAVVLFWPAPAAAQRRLGPRGGVRSVVVFGIGGFGYPRYVFYDPFYEPWYGPWYDPWYGTPYAWQYPRGPYPPGYYPARLIDDRTAALRLDVRPRQAQVFIDGYLAGVVDDFDGIFQRVHVRPGEHEMVFFLEGYKTVTQRLLLRANSSDKISYTMLRLEKGETSEPPPTPESPDEPGPTELRRPEPRAPYGPRRPAPEPGEPGPPPAGGTTGAPPNEPASNHTFGTFSIKVQPADAEVYVDGEKWVTPQGQDRLVLQLGEGKHRVEVRKDGFEKYSSEIQVRRGETTTLNVSLLRADSEELHAADAGPSISRP